MKMEIKLSMAIASHLSDAQHEIALGQNELATKRLDFVKKLVFHFKDLDKYIDIDFLNEIFESL